MRVVVAFLFLLWLLSLVGCSMLRGNVDFSGSVSTAQVEGAASGDAP